MTDDPDQLKFIDLLPRIRNAVNDENTIDDWKFLLKNEYTIEKAKNFEGNLENDSNLNFVNSYFQMQCDFFQTIVDAMVIIVPV